MCDLCENNFDYLDM